MHEGFVARYDTTGVDDGLPPGEGVFLPCSFWYVDNLALDGSPRRGAGRCSSGSRGSPTTSGCSPRSTTRSAKRQLGNFPQAFTHIQLVNSAFNLAARAAAARGRPRKRAAQPRGRRRPRVAARALPASLTIAAGLPTAEPAGDDDELDRRADVDRRGESSAIWVQWNG